MSRITKQDTNGVKPLLSTGELGYDNYPTGGDVGRVYVGTGTENIALAKKTEVIGVDGKADAHIARVDNPHSVTKTQVGLGSVDNTSDANKPISTAQQTALNLKADGSTVSSHTGNTSNPHSVTKAQVGLGLVDNTSDASKPVSTATQTALNLKANQSTTYTKTEVDTNLATKVNNTGGSISGNLQINGTTYLQGGRKNFFVWGQGTMNGGYVHLKTNRLTNESQMHSVLFEGYDYGGSKPILCAVAWYNYGGSGTPINIGSTGSHTVSVYKSSDGYAVIVLTSSNYYVGFTLSQAWTNQGLSDITITASSSSASSSGVY